MSRQALTGDDAGKWFDPTKAVKFDEATWWNGSNQISKATGSQWNHEALYFTKSGNWVLNSWSQYQNVAESWTTISQDEAIRWLIVNERTEAPGLPDAVAELVRRGVEDQEV